MLLKRAQIPSLLLQLQFSMPACQKIHHGMLLPSAHCKGRPVGQPVSVYLWKQEVAQGILVTQPHQFPIMAGSGNQGRVMISVSTTRTRALIEINNVLAPKYILTHHRKTLEELKGHNVSFLAVVNLSSLKTRSLEPAPPVLSGPPQLPGDVALIRPPSTSSEQSAAEDDNGSDSDNSDVPDQASPNVQMDHYNGEFLLRCFYIRTSGSGITSLLASIPSFWTKFLKTKSKTDLVANLDERLYVPHKDSEEKHILHDHFAAAFSDTMLVPDKGDKQCLVDYFTKKGTTWEAEHYKRPDWVWK
ncbi:hypothetical protein B0H17DRAFT_1137229 [Mycena rosella]|uniref:Uncharacterized protein n=1 Tax=Mycena rosella TaxID=1033263 RepID=A0AAD7D9N2_MYCRO|nr:hypothetical protein B0H17DRAFT_1137229 [Mycena rosella]